MTLSGGKLVATINPTNGQGLVYISSNSRWEPGFVSSTTISVSAPITYTSGVIGIDKSSVTLLGSAPTTSNIPEGSNLYFTTGRATASISATAPITYTSGVIAVDGSYLSTASAASTYLTQSSATATYLQLSSATSNYLTKSSATATYLQLSSATATYLQLSSATATYLNLSSATVTYLNVSSATATYLTKSSATATYFASTAPTTSNIPEGTNLYFTTGRATAAITATSPLSNTSGTLSISSNLPGASTSYIQNSNTLQSGATAYPTYLLVGSSATITALLSGTSAYFSGEMGIGVSSPTALLHFKAGTASSSTAPLKFSTGTLLTTFESGAIETDSSNNLYYGDAVQRQKLAFTTSSQTFTAAQVFNSSVTIAVSSFGINGVGYIWPSADGSSGQALTTNGSKLLSFATISGGSGTPLAVSSNSVIVTSPTVKINFTTPIVAALNGSTTAQISLDPSSVTLQGNAPFLTQSSATATYFNILSSTTLLTTSSATANYLSLSSAAATYLNVSSAAATYVNKLNDVTIYSATSTAIFPYSFFGPASSLKSANYTLVSTDTIVMASATAAGITLTLPASPRSGEYHEIKKVDISTGTVTISGSQNIDDSGSVIFSIPYTAFKLFYDGTQWRIF